MDFGVERRLMATRINNGKQALPLQIGNTSVLIDYNIDKSGILKVCSWIRSLAEETLS